MTGPTPDERWEQGIDHDPRSEKIARGVAKIDFDNGDLLCLKFGGDGDNGETLMFLLDCYFAQIDEDERDREAAPREVPSEPS